METKGDFKDFEHGVVVGARRAQPSISKSADLLSTRCLKLFKILKDLGISSTI